MHSKPKLALAVLTSPSAAFHEIVERKLLGTALMFVALTGLVSMIGAAARVMATGPVQMFAFGKDNPFTWLGLCLLYAFALQKLLKWLGTEVDYVTVVIILGWSHVLLLVHQIAGVAWGFAALAGLRNPIAMQVLEAFRNGLPVWYLFVVGVGLQSGCQITLARGLMSYFVVSVAATIAFSYTYGQARMTPFQHGLSGIAMSVVMLAPQVPDSWLPGADQIPRLAAAVIGAVLGLIMLGRSLGWDPGIAKRRAASVGLIGLAGFGIYFWALYNADYYGKLAFAQRSYDLDKFAKSAGEMEALLPAFRDKLGITADPHNSTLILDIAETYYLAGDADRSIANYRKFEGIIRKAELGKNQGKGLAIVDSGIGAVYDQEKKYDLAVKQFQKAAKSWPEFREPWSRLAVTYDRMGQYDKAIQAGNHAVKKLKSEAAVAYVALAEAYEQTGDAKQAQAAIDQVKKIDDALAKKIGAKPGDWKNAVDKLTARDLKYPLEKQIVAPPPPKAKAAKKK